MHPGEPTGKPSLVRIRGWPNQRPGGPSRLLAFGQKPDWASKLLRLVLGRFLGWFQVRCRICLAEGLLDAMFNA